MELAVGDLSMNAIIPGTEFKISYDFSLPSNSFDFLWMTFLPSVAVCRVSHSFSKCWIAKWEESRNSLEDWIV